MVIKLRELLNEFNINKRRHLGTGSSGEMFYKFFQSHLGAIDTFDFIDKVGKKSAKEVSIVDLIKKHVRKASIIPVPGNPTLIVCKTNQWGEDETVYTMFDTAADMQYCCIGFIDVRNVSTPDYGYNPNSVFKIEGTVRRIHLTEVAKEYIGQGFGSLLYQTVWNDSAALASDTMLFKGSYAMWVKKILPEAELFGVVLGQDIERSGSPKVIIPLNSTEQATKAAITNKGENFIAFKKNVPEPVRKVAYNLKGVDPSKELVVYRMDGTIKDRYTDLSHQHPEDPKSYKRMNIFDILDDCDNMYDLYMKLYEDGDVHQINSIIFGNGRSKNNRVSLLLFEDATLIVKDLGSGKLVNVLV
jgi:hypothetical protein